MFPSYSSAHYGNDSACLDELIEVHCDAENPVILDCTYNRGIFWSRSRFQPAVRSDIADGHSVDLQADCTALPFRAETFDVIVFDPPYIPDHSRVKTFWERSFSTVKKQHERGLSVNPMLSAFLREAKRVLKLGGIALVKIQDIVMSGRYQWQHVYLINAAEVLGMTPCDLKVKLTPSAGYMKPPQWKTLQHFQKVHTYWIVIRNSKSCHRVNPMVRPKPAQDTQLALFQEGGELSSEVNSWPICVLCNGTGTAQYPEGPGLCMQCSGIGHLNPCFVNKSMPQFLERPQHDKYSDLERTPR